MGIWALQAGKDVYIEKPCCHYLWEGRQLVRATKKYNRIVQHGTNNRSAGAVIEAVQKMREGLIGDVYLARGLCFNGRNTIGRAPEESGSGRSQLRPLGWPLPTPPLYAQPFSLQLALVLGHRQRRHR